MNLPSSALRSATGPLVLFAATVLSAACSNSTDCSKVTLTIATQTGPYIASALTAAAPKWQAKSCGTVKVVEFPWSELYPKIATSLTSGEATFDAITFAPAWSADFKAYLDEMPAAMRQGKDWDDIHAMYRERMMVFDGQVLSQSMDGDVHTYTYRSDLFDDAQQKAAFRAKYNYDLAVPQTWKQYLDIAEFFQRPSEGLWGTAEAFRRGGQQFWFLFSHAAAYTNHPSMPGSMFFDPDTMAAQINNPGWLRGLEEYIRASKLAPPNALNFSFGEVNAAVAGGQVAESIGWGDTGVIAADPKQSKIAGKVGSAILPGSNEIWNYKSRKWDTFPETVYSPFMAFGGWQIGVPHDSKNKEAAWDFIKTLTSPEVSGLAIVTGGSGVNPYRYSHMRTPELWSKLFTPREAKEYLSAQEASLNAKNVALDMRIPGYFSYTEVLEIELSKALAGDVTPQQALDTVAREWDRLTNEFGRNKQLGVYRDAMGLPPKK